jgi:hypothetical protein
MSIKRTLAVIFFSWSYCTVSGQNGNPYEIVRTLARQMEASYPIVDSLCPFSISTFHGKDWSFLKNKEKRNLKKAVKAGNGIRIHQDSLQNLRLISAHLIFEAFSNFDSTSLKVIEKNQPFYMLSNPLFFAKNSRAIVALTLIKGFGYTYIFEKRNHNWIVIKSIYRWM